MFTKTKIGASISNADLASISKNLSSEHELTARCIKSDYGNYQFFYSKSELLNKFKNTVIVTKQIDYRLSASTGIFTEYFIMNGSGLKRLLNTKIDNLDKTLKDISLSYENNTTVNKINSSTLLKK